MAYETILYEKFDSVAKITMNRPEARNAESLLMTVEWQDAFKVAEADRDVRVIILAGAGKDFSAGHDLGSAARERHEKEGEKVHPPLGTGVEAGLAREYWRWLDGALYVRDIWKPTIAQVQGHCIMGGWILATMCDLIIASEDASFADMAVRFGVPAVEFFTHPWELGTRKSKEFLFTGDPITAQEAYIRGLVNRVVPREQLEEEVMKLANRIAISHPFALKVVKMAHNYTQDIQGFRNSMIPQILLHHLGHAYSRENPDYAATSRARRDQEGKGVKAFMAARDKEFDQDDPNKMRSKIGQSK